MFMLLIFNADIFLLMFFIDGLIVMFFTPIFSPLLFDLLVLVHSFNPHDGLGQLS
jgi:hypothetical protein